MINISVIEGFEEILINGIPANVFKEIKSMYPDGYHKDAINKWIKVENILFFKEIPKE